MLPQAPAFLGPVAAASFFIFILGILDDRYELGALLRMASFILATSLALVLDPIFALQTLNMYSFGVPIVVSFGSAATVVTLLMVVGFVNASNMADGMNGQFLGSLIVWGLLLSIHFGIYAGPVAAFPYLVLVITSCIALAFNLRGALFSGSAGSYGGSLFVALSAIAAYHLSEGRMDAGLPLFWFYLPVVDCLRLFVTRASQRRSPFSPDRNHVHHVLLEFMSAPAALIVYLLLLGAPGIAALIDDQLGWITFVTCLTAYALIFPARRFAVGRSLVSTERPASPVDRV